MVEPQSSSSSAQAVWQFNAKRTTTTKNKFESIPGDLPSPPSFTCLMCVLQQKMKIKKGKRQK